MGERCQLATSKHFWKHPQDCEHGVKTRAFVRKNSLAKASKLDIKRCFCEVKKQRQLQK